LGQVGFVVRLDGMDLTPVLSGKAETVERSLFWRRRATRAPNKGGFVPKGI
jgi:hypothetical protein